MIPNAEIFPKFNVNMISLRKTGSKLNCFLDNKGVYCYHPIDVTMPMKPIQSPSVPTKPYEA